MQGITRRIALASLLALGATGAGAQDKKALLVAEPARNVAYLPVYAAVRKGFYADEGLDVRTMTIDSGGGHTNAVLSGQAFAFLGGPEHNAFAKVKGGELRAVVNVVDRGNVYLLAPKGKEPPPGADMAAYLKGKSIATGYYSGTPNSITRYIVKKNGLDAKADVTLNEMSTSAVLAAVKSGQSQIAVTTEPLITQGIREGIWGEPFMNVPRELGPYAYSTLNVRLASIKDDPATVQKFVRATIKGLKFVYASPDEAATIAKQEFPTMAPDDLKATLERTFKDELWSRDGMISEASWTMGKSVVRDAGILKQDVPYDQIIDMQFVKAAQSATN